MFSFCQMWTTQDYVYAGIYGSLIRSKDANLALPDVTDARDKLAALELQ